MVNLQDYLSFTVKLSRTQTLQRLIEEKIVTREMNFAL